MKKILKSILGFFYCSLYTVKYKRGVYIGFGSKIVGGKSVHLSKNVKLMPSSMYVCHRKVSHLFINEETEIGMFSRIACMGKIYIGKEVITGPNVFIADYNHNYQNINISIMKQGNCFNEVNTGYNIFIGDGSWIGTNVVIIGNVQIGKNCVIGANSVVTKDIPDYCVAIGSPAKVVKKYNFETNHWDTIK